MAAVPAVVVVNDHDSNDDIDSVDPNLAVMLNGKVRMVSLAKALEMAASTPVQGLMCLCHAPVTGELLDSLGGAVKTVSNYGVGVDTIDLGACTVRGVSVGNTPGVLTEATADMGFALLMAAARRIPEANEYAKSTAYTEYRNMIMLGRAVHGATLGIVGMGRIGTAVAKRATGFGMKILYHNRSRNEAGERETGAVKTPLKSLLATSDYVVLVCPDTPETRGLIDEEAFATMKSTAILVNIARGPVVDTAAMTNALQTGQIAAAALDVFDPEPLPAEHPLKSMPNVIMAPHRGSATVEARNGMADLCVQNLLLGLEGKPLAASPIA